MKQIVHIFSFFFFINVTLVSSQTIADGLPYQTVVRNNFGQAILSQQVSFKSCIHEGTANGTLVWEETFFLSTDSKGLVNFIIGKGVSTGMGSIPSFSSINFGSNSYYVKISIDPLGGTSYTDIGSAQLLSVPYAFHAIKSDEITNYYLNQLGDVNVLNPLLGKLLKWNGLFWISDSDLDSDTAIFAINTFSSIHSDTSYYSYLSSTTDSVTFSYYSDTAQYVSTSDSSLNTINSSYSDTAFYALASSSYAWAINGNSVGTNLNYAGSVDAKDLVFKTNNAEVMRLKATGNIQVGLASGLFDFSIYGTDGVLSKGTFGSGAFSISGASTKMYWYSSKAAFRVGGVSGNQWDDISIGNYSFAAGYNCVAGTNSFATGNSSIASGDYTIALGRKSQATAVGVYPSGVSVALGDSSIASTPRSVSIGRGNLASTNNATIAIGFFNRATGAVATAFGFNTIASGNYSFVLGYYASSNLKSGSFVYADASSSAVTNSSVNNQFMVRASGGVLFYSDPLNIMGISLPPGGGSWASISDRNKKENFKFIHPELILEKIETLKITSWNYKSQVSSIKHIGPMAQDFYKTFHLGDGNKKISMIDIDGVTLLGIKALIERTKELAPLLEIDEVTLEVKKLDDLDQLNKRLDELEMKFSSQNIE